MANTPFSENANEERTIAGLTAKIREAVSDMAGRKYTPETRALIMKRITARVMILHQLIEEEHDRD